MRVVGVYNEVWVENEQATDEHATIRWVQIASANTVPPIVYVDEYHTLTIGTFERFIDDPALLQRATAYVRKLEGTINQCTWLSLMYWLLKAQLPTTGSAFRKISDERARRCKRRPFCGIWWWWCCLMVPVITIAITMGVLYGSHTFLTPVPNITNTTTTTTTTEVTTTTTEAPTTTTEVPTTTITEVTTTTELTTTTTEPLTTTTTEAPTTTTEVTTTTTTEATTTTTELTTTTTEAPTTTTELTTTTTEAPTTTTEVTTTTTTTTETPTTTTEVTTTTTTEAPTTTTTTTEVTTTTTEAPTTTTEAPTTTTEPPTEPPSLPCGLVNPSFEYGNMSGWTIQSTFDGYPAISGGDVLLSPSGCQDGSFCTQHGTPSLSQGCGQAAPGTSRFYQDWNITSCSLVVSFWYGTLTNPYSESGDPFSFSATINEAGFGTQIASLFNFIPAEGFPVGWQFYSCNVCDGSCGGVNMSSYVGQTLSIVLTYNAIDGPCGGLFWDNFCIQNGTFPPIVPNITCGLINPDFEYGNFTGWLTSNVGLESSGSGPVIESSGCQSGTYCVREGILSTADPPTCVQNGTDGSYAVVQQTWFMSDCTLDISFWYRTTGSSFSTFANIFRAEVLVPGPTVLLLNAGIPPGSTAFSQYTCNVCDGSCGGVNMTPYIGQYVTLALEYYYVGGSVCGGVMWDNVCIQ